MKNSVLSHGKGKVLKKKIQHSATRVMKKGGDVGMEPIKLKISKVFQKPPLLQLEEEGCVVKKDNETSIKPINIQIKRSKALQKRPLSQL